MKAARFDHHEPTTVDEAVSLIDEADEPTLLAGGQSLVPMMRFRLAQPETVVDLNGIESLDYLREEDGNLRVGALVRHGDVETAALIAENYGSFYDTAPEVGDPQVRNRGTVVGSVTQADPKGDWGTVLLAHEGEVVARGPDGERTIPAEEFFLFPYETALEAAELATEIRLPVSGDDEGSAYHKLKRKLGDFAMAGAAARLALEDGAIADASIALTSLALTNTSVPDAAAHLVDETPDADLFGEAGEIAAEASDPESDEHGSAAYKRNMARVLTQRALADALERARRDAPAAAVDATGETGS